MKSALLVQILLVGSLLALSVPTNVFRVAAVPSYMPAVKPGDEATYGNVTGFWQSNASPGHDSILPNATVAVQPHATIDLSRSMKQITVGVALNNTPDVPPFSGVSVFLQYDTQVLRAVSLNYSSNVLSSTGFPLVILRDCLDGLPANNGPSTLCGADDAPGVTSFAEVIQGGATSDGTQGIIFFTTFNVNTTAPNLSQIQIKSSILENSGRQIPTATLDGYYSSLNCGGVACSSGQANFNWSPKTIVQGTVVTFNGNSSFSSSGAVITDYFWTFGDTASLKPYSDSGTSPTTAYIYLLGGTYSVTLTITDSKGVKAFKTQMVTVVNPSPAGAPPLIGEFIHVRSVHVSVLTTSGSVVNAALSFDFNNGTGPRTSFLSGDVATGSGNLTFWILSSGLTAGDSIYDVPNSAINRTDTEFFAGALRQVVHLTLGVNAGNSNFADWTWDQSTGILVSFETRVFQQNGSNGFASVTITSTNLWSGGDFGISANPLFLTIHKANFYDPFAFNVSTILLRSIGGFSGTVQLQATATGQLGLTFSSSLVGLGSNQTASSILQISASNASPGTYFVTVTGSQFTGPVLQHSVTITVQVVTPPPDFQLFLFIPFSSNPIFAGSTASIQVQLQSNGFSTFAGNVSLTGQVNPLINNGPTLSFNPNVISFTPGPSSSQLTISTVATTPPGNYNITVIGTSGSVVHTTSFQLTVLPPPTITATPSSGAVGTQVTVHGTGFISPSQGPFAVVELEMTFDDQLVGLFFIQNNSFNFTFNVPVSQPGIMHTLHAKELYPSNLDVQTSFFVQVQPNSLSLTVSTGTIYFPGDTATFFARTNLNGQPTTVTSLQVVLIQPNGTSLTLNAVPVSTGFYKATFTVPSKGSIGTYAVIVKAHQTGSGDASALSGFEVKPTWLQANSKNIATATGLVGAVGTLGVMAFAWRKGYLTRKSDEVI